LGLWLINVIAVSKS